MPAEKEAGIESKYVKWFSELGKDDAKSVGGKAANLGELIKLKMPVPQGFAILASAYNYFLEKTGIKDRIYEMLSDLDEENTEELEKISAEIKKIIVDADMPADLNEEIAEEYEILSYSKEIKNSRADALSILKMSEPSFVAVRSSATAEDSEKASFAGQQETFLNVKGRAELIQAVKKCFASLFTSRSIYYRIKNNFRHEDVLIAVVIQLMINSDKSGVIFSRNPITQENNIVIESVFGLGEGIVSGRIKPDYALVSKNLEIIEKKVSEKKTAITRNSEGKTIIVSLTEEKSKQEVLTDYEIKKLADYAIKLENHYKIPQDIEFAISSGEIFILQTRPITTLEKKEQKEEIGGRELLSGLAASPGIASGEVRIINSLEDLQKIKKGDILVTKMTNPDMVVAMQKSSAIITDEGGLTAHAAIISREMGIPCIVGTKNATQVLKENQLVTVDSFRGKVYGGAAIEKQVEILPIAKTKTKIKVIVDLPYAAERASKTKCEAVGLLRLEGIIAESGKHPFYFLKTSIKEYEEMIFSGISKIASYFKELWIRTSDIRTDEFRNLQGAEKKIETNPMLGMHGIRASFKHPKILEAEILAMKKLSETGKKIGIMAPQIISVDEVKQLKETLKSLEAENLSLGVMIETPASVQIIDELCEQGISFISFGTNDLTQYTLAVDRGNEQVQYLYDETHPAVLSQLAHAIKVCKKYNVETSICGQAGSNEKIVEFLVREGIGSISVNADKAFEISNFVRKLEESENLEEKPVASRQEIAGLTSEIEETAKEVLEEIEKKSEEIAEEIKEDAEEKAQQVAEAVKEECQDLDFGFDVFSHEEKTEKQAEKKSEEMLDIF